MVPGPFRQLCRDTEGSSLHRPDIDFFGTVFAEVPPPAMAAPPANIVDDQPAPTPQVPQKRHSKRLLARPSSVPVSRRSTHRLMRQLDIVGQDQAIGDEAAAQYEKMYKGPMPRKTVAALAAVSRVASGVVMAALAAINCYTEVAVSEVEVLQGTVAGQHAVLGAEEDDLGSEGVEPITKHQGSAAPLHVQVTGSAPSRDPSSRKSGARSGLWSCAA
ncbi:hypothetical protein SETIT_7G286600v2 [Setaria italica]|uniref:Uncharacterized protein n=1 Tax=Setaria italica TaxID=4555 RepID=A0A368S0U1_SETIT|nr:hypothetical protein SETIT_7G286600v2 [Setaria italica]